jgi:hypothetical protein
MAAKKHTTLTTKNKQQKQGFVMVNCQHHRHRRLRQFSLEMTKRREGKLKK